MSSLETSAMFVDVRPSQLLHIGVQCNPSFLHPQAFPQGPLHPHDTSLSRLSGATGEDVLDCIQEESGTGRYHRDLGEPTS